MTRRKSLPTEAGESQLTMKDMWTSAKRKSESEHMGKLVSTIVVVNYTVLLSVEKGSMSIA